MDCIELFEQMQVIYSSGPTAIPAKMAPHKDTKMGESKSQEAKKHRRAIVCMQAGAP
jgi:hypothetical protein